jgi:hypothetical protein
MSPEAVVWGLELLVYAALSYWCMGPYATSLRGLRLLMYELLVYEALTSSLRSRTPRGLKLLVYEA